MLELVAPMAMATVMMVKDGQNNDDRRHRMLPVLEGQRHIDHKREQRSWLRPCLSRRPKLDFRTLPILRRQPEDNELLWLL